MCANYKSVNMPIPAILYKDRGEEYCRAIWKNFLKNVNLLIMWKYIECQYSFSTRVMTINLKQVHS